MAFHADADDGNLGHLCIGDQAVVADGIATVFQDVGATHKVGLRAGKGHVGFAFVAADVLNDHVDVDVCVGQRRKDVGHRARTVRHARKGDLRLILVGGNSGDQLAFHLILLQFCVGHNHRAGDTVGVRRAFINE